MARMMIGIWGVIRGYLACGLAAGVCALLPAQALAQIRDRVVFSVKPIVMTSEIATKPGETTFLVASNAPFALSVSDYVGDISVSVDNVKQNAQMPGAQEACRFIVAAASSSLYQAERRTAARPGTPESQAIELTVRYNPETSPVFSFKAGKATGPTLSAGCQGPVS